VPARPTRAALALEAIALALACALAISLTPSADWDLGLLFSLLALSVVSDLSAIDAATSRVKVSASFLAIVLAIVFLGSAPAALIGVATTVAVWARRPYPAHYFLFNLVAFAWFPLAAGIVFHEMVAATGVDAGAGSFYLLVVGLFSLALALNFAMIGAYASYVERSSFAAKVRRVFLPVLPSELASALLAAGIAYLYHRAGLSAIGLVAVALLVFQHLIGALLLSQQRADELELRANQLAGFQVALLSALLRTLDLRDRMTARHSAAVARYSREIATAAGLSLEEQDLAHTAGLLHDIGKFVLPDRILKQGAQLTEEDWRMIRQHPYEGARIVSQIDGYRPIGDIILAHHERIDGLGYPRGLPGEMIPEIARIVSVADVYDVLTARDSYRTPVSSFEAITELRRVAGSQLDPRFVEIFIDILDSKDLAYKHGEDADFEAELALDRRIHDYVNAGATAVPRVPIHTARPA
jgi:putative nucleotidyltransferase with HDIG domain